jgi:hypothetical protein
MLAIATILTGMRSGFLVIGCVAVAYFAVRVVATIYDVYLRWRDDDWD